MSLGYCSYLQNLQAARIAAVAVSGSIVALLTVFATAAANLKQISDLMMDCKSFIKFKDHGDKIGYQHAVRLHHLSMS